MDEPTLYRFKVLLLGAPAVGKTSLLYRFAKDKFAESYMSTIGLEFLMKELKFKQDVVKLTIWDIGGQERFKFLRKNFYNGTNGALMIFDLTKKETFEALETWLAEMKEMLGKDVPIVLVGNKLDLVDENGKTIGMEEIMKFNQTHNCLYIETSAKTGKNVEEAYIELCHKMA